MLPFVSSFAMFGWLTLVVVITGALFIYMMTGRSKLTDGQRALRARTALSALHGSSRYNLAEHIVFESVNSDGSLSLSLKLTADLHNFFGSMHGGCIASAVDVATTVAILAYGGFPGVSTSLGVTYVAGCGPDEVVRIVPNVVKLGRTLSFTECKLYRTSDNTLMARGWHVKHVAAPNRLIALLLAVRPSIMDLILTRIASPGRVIRIGRRTFRFGGPIDGVKEPLHASAFDKVTEPDTGLPRNEAGKLQYFSKFGEVGRPFQGWDKSLAGSLQLAHGGVANGDAAPGVWILRVDKAQANSFMALHGGCTASLVDVLGSAVVAFGDAYECGVAVALDVQYASCAMCGEDVEWTAQIIKRGGRLVTAEVKAMAIGKSSSGTERRRLIALGTVTKSLRGLSKTSAGKT